MGRVLRTLIGVLVAAFVVAFGYRVCVTVGVPFVDYPFMLVFKNVAWSLGIVTFLFKSARWIGGGEF